MPDGWKTAKFGDPNVSEIIMGQSPPSDSYNSKGNGMPFYQGKADFGDRHPTTTKWCLSPIKTAKNNDILISVRAPVGDVNICKENSCIGRGVTAIRSKEETYYEYVFYYLLKEKNSIEMMGTGSTFKSINKTVLENFPIILPPLPEQKRIAKILQSIDRKIENHEAKKATLQDFFKTVLNELIAGN